MKIKIPSNQALAVYPAGANAVFIPGGSAVEVFKPGIKWLLRNEMSSASGEVGTWAERDTESKIAFTSGWAEFTPQATPVYAEQDLVCSAPAITRAAGAALFGKFRCTTDGSFYPLALVTSATPTWNATHVEAGFHRAATALSLTATYNATAGPIIATFVADGTLYYTCITPEGAAGYKFYMQGGALTNWTLLFRSATGATATLYAAMAGYSAAFGADFVRAVQVAVSNPLLSDTFSGTFGTPDVIGGSWLHAGTWATAAGVVANTPVAGAELVTDGGFENWTSPTDLTSWTEVLAGTSTINQETMDVHGGLSALRLDIDASNSASYPKQTLTSPAHRWTVVSYWAKASAAGKNLKISTENDAGFTDFSARNPGTTWTNYIFTSRTVINNGNIVPYRQTAASSSLYFDDVSAKHLSISSLLALQLLTTTDVLAEMVISAYTLATQTGFVQSDRPFAFAANADAAAGQPVIVLKGLTNAVPDTDTLTIKHPVAGGTVYTIASVSALVAGVQTITLDDNLVEAVSADDMVGVNWASWNGAIRYFDGAGNIKLDEVKAGVYTNRASTATAFSANARFVMRKIGTEYRGFYNEVLQASLTTVDAASMVGTYWGVFSTLAANTITSFVVYDTGNVTNAYSTLDKYSRD